VNASHVSGIFGPIYPPPRHPGNKLAIRYIVCGRGTILSRHNPRRADKMSTADRISLLISECLVACRANGFNLAVLAQFIEEMRLAGYPEADVKMVDGIMRHLLVSVRSPEHFPGDATAEPLRDDDGKSIKLIVI
jgi:hypothetical protein